MLSTLLYWGHSSTATRRAAMPVLLTVFADTPWTRAPPSGSVHSLALPLKLPLVQLNALKALSEPRFPVQPAETARPQAAAASAASGRPWLPTARRLEASAN
ncbi:hypothetical protein JYU34_005662 [Plutella xylostella]|uniref:Secreted protein n=1 Tax=Plutella xylostella TaxID=51655 RepID=A0ABQ7QTS9_PLUXY|nr:hypothetical protein JYU34_005662 [Plutella xylostella]